MPQGVGYPPGTPSTPPGPAASHSGPSAPPAPAAPPAGGGPVPQLSAEEYAILDAAFTPQVVRILQKVLPPEVSAMLQPFAVDGPQPVPGAPTAPQTGLQNVNQG